MKKQGQTALFAALIAACTLTLCACEGAQNGRAEAYLDTDITVTARDYAMMADNAGFNGAEAERQEAADAPQSKSTTDAAARKIIYSCAYNVETNNFDESVKRLDSLIEKFSAYNESAETYGNAASGRSANYVIRVPAEKYEDFRKEAGTIGTVVRASEYNRDVSESYFDTEARLESARLHEERLLAILEKSDSLEDVLLLESSLSDVRYEIESLTGTLKKYDSLIDYATITVSIEEVLKVTVIEETPKTFGERVWQACKGSVNAFGDGMENFLIILIYALPVLLVLGVIALIVVLIVKGSIRRGRKKKEKAAESRKE